MKPRLITLLTMGRALDNARDRKGAYTLRYVNKFPKFTPAAPAARAAMEALPASHSGAAAQSSLFGAPGAGAVAAPPEQKAERADQSNRSDPTDRTDRTSQASQPPQPAAPKSRFPRFLKLSAFLAAVFAVVPKTAARFRGRLRFRTGESRPRAQAELALEKVTVVRNDLSEADLEVVAVQPKPENPPAAEAPAGGPAGNPWKRVRARWAKQKNPQPFAPGPQAGSRADRAQTTC
jgi:hypothetical protein